MLNLFSPSCHSGRKCVVVHKWNRSTKLQTGLLWWKFVQREKEWEASGVSPQCGRWGTVKSQETLFPLAPSSWASYPVYAVLSLHYKTRGLEFLITSLLFFFPSYLLHAKQMYRKENWGWLNHTLTGKMKGSQRRFLETRTQRVMLSMLIWSRREAGLQHFLLRPASPSEASTALCLWVLETLFPLLFREWDKAATLVLLWRLESRNTLRFFIFLQHDLFPIEIMVQWLQGNYIRSDPHIASYAGRQPKGRIRRSSGIYLQRGSSGGRHVAKKSRTLASAALYVWAVVTCLLPSFVKIKF